ncbi:MAG: hypothetical protein JHC33_15135 [Ignisphaera sp.]|nr:hypothetical protein [Ignisphaera sp.]
MAIKNPYVGQKVRLNNVGLETIFGTTLGLSAVKQKVMTITGVESIPMNKGEETSIIRIDDPELDDYFLISFMFDEVI